MPRAVPSIAHVDLDAFFAAIEQRDKPSLRGRPVVVGGLGGRGVVSTASYEARTFGVGSAMSTQQARRLCPHAAYLYPRFGAYRQASRRIMAALAEFSPLVEPLSLDEAYVDLAAGPVEVTSAEDARGVAAGMKARIREVTDGLTGSAGVGSSKLIAKLASDLDKPDGLLVVDAGAEQAMLDPLPVRRLPGVGPATAEQLRRVGITTVAQARAVPAAELVALLGNAAGHGLARLVVADDDRPISPDRPTKSVSVEDTFERDLTDPAALGLRVDHLAARVCRRLQEAGLSGRTVTLKVRTFDFTTVSRSTTFLGATDDDRVVGPAARRLLRDLDTSGGVRLLGVGVSGLADWVQDDLFTELLEPAADLVDVSAAAAVGPGPDTAVVDGPPTEPVPVDRSFADRFPGARAPGWQPGQDVRHDAHGPGWVWGAGVGRVTVRFETAHTGPGPVLTLAVDDPALHPDEPWNDKGPDPDPGPR